MNVRLAYSATTTERRIARLGLQVPRDVSVIGCGNMPAYIPRLTTFDQQQAEIGRRTAELYLKRVNQEADGRAPETIRIPAKLLSRGSTGPVRRLKT